MAKGKKTIDFGEFSEHIQVNDNAKKVHELLGGVLKKYEKEFGRIEKPKQLQMLEKKQKPAAKKESEKIETPSYIS